MGQSYHNCAVCEEIFSDYEDHEFCSNCDSFVCDYCSNEMVKKYGVIGENHPKTNWYGKNALIKCDGCDYKETEESSKKIIETVVKFMKDHDINHEETIYQTDGVILDALDFINDLFQVSKPILKKEEVENEESN